MKKLVYILVAVFTMVSVNAFGTAFELHYAYPGGNTENDAVVNEINRRTRASGKSPLLN